MSQHSRQNRLIREKSPYLLQHAANPVDWYPWGQEAFARALCENKPVFLSIGYSSCHWCHVMAHESFENADVARVMNDCFVCVKVDREERPDIDHIYMTAVMAMTQKIYEYFIPNKVVIHRPASDSAAPVMDIAPFVRGQGAVTGKPTVYVCVGHACRQPVLDAAQLQESLRDL